VKNTNKPGTPAKSSSKKPSGTQSAKRVKHLPGCQAADSNSSKKWVPCECR
jgi:hypothetical protein